MWYDRDFQLIFTPPQKDTFWDQLRDAFDSERSEKIAECITRVSFSATLVLGLAFVERAHVIESTNTPLRPLDAVCESADTLVSSVENSGLMEKPVAAYERFVAEHEVLRGAANQLRRWAGQETLYRKDLHGIG
ncbi:MAG TPA: hypothetical protein VK983_04195 [Candidatus Limnocylindrales bacterium]|nr:hypothetical protein [Candidatus Limnocylindrales bacterium]